MSIEEIQKLKEKIGLKLYNQTIGAAKPAAKSKKKAEFKRENKNRPREASSKAKVGRLRDVVGFKLGVAKKSEPKRDPRFDALCGTFDDKVRPTSLIPSSISIYYYLSPTLPLFRSLSPHSVFLPHSVSLSLEIGKLNPVQA